MHDEYGIPERWGLCEPGIQSIEINRKGTHVVVRMRQHPVFSRPPQLIVDVLEQHGLSAYVYSPGDSIMVMVKGVQHFETVRDALLSRIERNPLT